MGEKQELVVFSSKESLFANPYASNMVFYEWSQ